jgi:hypothetical protein
VSPVKYRPDTTTPQGIPCKSCRRGHTRHSQAAIPEHGNRASRIPACGTYRMAASIQMNMATSSLLRTPDMSARRHLLSKSHRLSEALPAILPTQESDISRPRIVEGRGSRAGLAVSHENSGVHFPLLRPCPCTFGTSPFLRTHCIARPLETLFMLVVRDQHPPFPVQPSPGLCLASLAKCSGPSANPTQPLAATPGAIRLCLVNNPVSNSLDFSGTVTGLTLPSSAAFDAC